MVTGDRIGQAEDVAKLTGFEDDERDSKAQKSTARRC